MSEMMEVEYTESTESEIEEIEPEVADGETVFWVVDKEALEITVPAAKAPGDIYKIRSPFRRIEIDCGRTYAFPIEKGETVTLKAYRSDMPNEKHTLFWKLIASRQEKV